MPIKRKTISTLRKGVKSKLPVLSPSMKAMILILDETVKPEAQPKEEVKVEASKDVPTSVVKDNNKPEPIEKATKAKTEAISAAPVEGSPSLRRSIMTGETDSIQPIMTSSRRENRVPMTRIRATIADRLIDAQQSTAALTTFNEVDMQAVMTLRNDNKKEFEAHFGVRLGFMSFFISACCLALQKFPEVNASIERTVDRLTVEAIERAIDRAFEQAIE